MKWKNKNKVLQNYCNENSMLHGENLQCNNNVANLAEIFCNNIGNNKNIIKSLSNIFLQA